MADTKPPVHQQAIGLALDIANGRHFLSRIVPLALLLADALLCGLVIWKVPCKHCSIPAILNDADCLDTEIDWVAYMQQISQFLSGERDYTKLSGDTGPLVYPAAHVYTYTGLYYLTNRGKDILLAQKLFAILYMVTLAVVMACYWQAKVDTLTLPLKDEVDSWIGTPIHLPAAHPLEATSQHICSSLLQ